jgi:hypothetical protein
MNIVKFAMSREYGWDVSELIYTHNEFNQYPREVIKQTFGYDMDAMDAMDQDEEYIVRKMMKNDDLTFEMILDNLDNVGNHLYKLAMHPNIPIDKMMGIIWINWNMYAGESRYIVEWRITLTKRQITLLSKLRQQFMEVDDHGEYVKYHNGFQLYAMFNAFCYKATYKQLTDLLFGKYHMGDGYKFREYFNDDDYDEPSIIYHSISRNPNIDIERLNEDVERYNYHRDGDHKIYIHWNYHYLSSNPRLKMRYVLNNLDKPWTYSMVLSNIGCLSVADSAKYFMRLLETCNGYSYLEWDANMDNPRIYEIGLKHHLLHPEFVAKNLYRIRDYREFMESSIHTRKMINDCHEIIAAYPFGMELISEYGDDEVLIKYEGRIILEKLVLNRYVCIDLIFKYNLQELPRFIHLVSSLKDIKYIMEHMDAKWDMDVLAVRLPIHVIEKELYKYSMSCVSSNPTITIDFVRRHRDKIDFEELARNPSLTFEMIDEFHEYMDMTMVSDNRMENEKKSQIARFIADAI